MKMFSNYLFNCRPLSGLQPVIKKAIKVPNVLIMTDDLEAFNLMNQKLAAILNPQKYLVYQLKAKSSFQPTKADTALVLALKPIQRPEKIVSYVRGGGLAFIEEQINGFEDKNLVVVTEDLKNLEIGSLRSLIGRFSDVVHDTKEPTNAMKITPCSFYCQNESIKNSFLAKSLIKMTRMTLKFTSDNLEISDEVLPVIFRENVNNFDFHKFYDNLKTKRLGRLVIHSEVVHSSFDLLEGPFLHDGVVVVVDRQLSGRGRSGNKWLCHKPGGRPQADLADGLKAR